RDITMLWESMYAGMRVRGHRAGFYLEAIAGVDIALWDIKGKAANMPISQLLGGCFRESVQVYASGIPALDINATEEDLAALVAEGHELREGGFKGVKVAIGRGVEGDLRTVRALRKGLG